jgi:hypothetical protein
MMRRSMTTLDLAERRGFPVRLRRGPSEPLLALIVLAATGACHTGRAQPVPVEEANVTAPDRLSKGEALPDAEVAFGLKVPTGLQLSAHFQGSAFLSGSLGFDATLEGVRSQVEPDHIELRDNRAIFPRVRIRGESDRLLHIELERTPVGTQVVIRDVTQPKVIEGLSEAERWKQVGRMPDGTEIDRLRVY